MEWEHQIGILVLQTITDLGKSSPSGIPLALPIHIRVHNIFHVSVLKKYIYDPKHVISWHDIRVRKYPR